MAGTILAFDTSAAHCAAALVLDGRLVEARREEMTRGQAERLMPLLEDLLSTHRLAWHDIDRIGVGIGPGNFTGIRISVAAARGLALGLGIPAVGISSFDALRGGTSGVAAIAAPRGMAYVQHDAEPPHLLPEADLPRGAIRLTDLASFVTGIARLAAGRAPDLPPAPLYLRPADAAPARDAPPVILDDR